MPLYFLNKTVEWTRPVDWLVLPNVNASEDKMVGLYAVFDTQSEFVAFTATGNFTVDWGDGSATENIASGVQAQHQYDYSAISASTLSTRSYKQVIITITPQAGQQLLSVDINKRHTSASAQTQASNWLDITCSCNPASTLGFSSAGSLIRSSMLEKCTILNGALRLSTVSMFSSCFTLQSVNLFNTGAVTNMTSMFDGCRSLESVPLFNTAAVTNMTSMLKDCGSLHDIPLFDTGSVTNMTTMFSGCSAIKTVPLFNTALVTNMTSMFLTCSTLLTVPLFNTASVTNFTSMFSGCFSLQYLPLFNMVAATTITSMLVTCRSLCTIPAFTLTSVTTATDFVLNSLDIGRSLVTGLGVDHNYTNCNLSATALNEIYTNLPVVVGKTITVTGNYGIAGDNPAIATAKGWTVVG